MIENHKKLRKGDNYLGLFSDYLEDCRDRICSNEVDPCLFINNSILRSQYSYQSFYKTENGNKIYSEDISERLKELEKIKANYLIAERILLKLKKTNEIASALVIDVIAFIDEQLHQSYIGVCEIINEHKKYFTNCVTDTIVTDSEDRISNDLLSSIMNGILYCLKSGSAIDTSECRKVVNDAANIICFFNKENFSFSKKQIFQYYLENVYKIHKAQCLCCNCHKPLFLDIPYCFNCYERN